MYNDFEHAMRMAKVYREWYPVGSRVELILMGDDPHPITPGTKGTVVYVDDMGQVGVHWDNGRSLALIPGIDSFKLIVDDRAIESVVSSEGGDS